MTASIRGGTGSPAWIYHEKQDSALCGQHCLNNLLQEPIYTAADLADIALQLDEIERQCMLEAGTDTPDALKFLAETSGNVDEAGNFSIQVLSEAVKRSHGLRLVSWDSSDVRNSVSTTGLNSEGGFVANRQSHWFAIRQINGKYWNLNSTLEHPEYITTFALEAFLHQLRTDGYAVFVVRGGALPPPKSSPGEEGGAVSWYREDALVGGGRGPKAAATDVWLNSGPGRRLDGGSNQPAKPATEGSGWPAASGWGNGGLGDEDADLMAALRASQEDSSGPGGGEEDELAQAIAMSLSETDSHAAVTAKASLPPVPDEPPVEDRTALRVQIRLPANRRLVRRFRSGDPAACLFTLVQQELANGAQAPLFQLVGPQGMLLDQAALLANASTFGSAQLNNASIMVRLK